MELTQVTALIGNVGFPIGIAVILIIGGLKFINRLMYRIDQITSEFAKLCQSIERMEEMLERTMRVIANREAEIREQMRSVYKRNDIEK